MEYKQQVPKILHLRAQKILQQKLKAVYQIDPSNPNIARCENEEGNILYLNFATGEELRAAQIKVIVEEWGKEDTEKLTGNETPPSLVRDDFEEEIKDKDGIAGEGNYTSFLSRDDLPETSGKEQKPKKSKGTTVTKKKSTSKKK